MQNGQNNSDPAEALRNTVALLFRRKQLILVVFTAILLAGVAATLLMPKQYESSMKILVRSDRADAIISPGHGGSLRIQDVDESRLNSEIELLTSRDLLRALVLECRLYEPADTGIEAEPDPMAVDQAVWDLKDALKIIPVKKTAVIQVTYAAASPSSAAAVLRTMTKLYFAKHLNVRRSGGTHELFQKQAATFQEKLRKAETDFTEFQQRTNVDSLGLEREILLRKLKETEFQLLETVTKLREGQRRIAETKAQLQELNPRILTQSRSVGNLSSVESLNTMLAELKNQRTELLTKYHEDDRLVKAVEQQIHDTEMAMKRAEGIVSREEETDVNPLHQQLQNGLAQAELDVAVLTARRDVLLNDQLAAYRGRLDALRDAKREDEQLKRTIEEAESNYELYAEKREEARIADLLDEEKIGNIAMAEEPSEPILPSSPKVALNLLLSLALAGFLSIGSAVAAEIFSGVVRTPQDVESATGLPVLATVALNARTRHG